MAVAGVRKGVKRPAANETERPLQRSARLQRQGSRLQAQEQLDDRLSDSDREVRAPVSRRSACCNNASSWQRAGP